MDKILTIYFPYYNQDKALEHNLKLFSNYNENIRKKICIFIVDDGSKKSPLEIVKKYIDLLDITLYRIDIDIPWNTPEANNLAFSKINTEYVFRTDIDHFFDENNMTKIINFLLLEKKKISSNKKYYVFKRKHIDTQQIIQPNKNVYLIKNEYYLETMGYNEFYSGNYGDDIDFIPRLNKKNIRTLLENIQILVNCSFSTHNLSRDISVNINKLKNKNNPHLTFRNKYKYIKLM